MDTNPLLENVYLGFLIFIRVSSIFVSSQTLLARIPAVIRLYISLIITVFILFTVNYQLALPTTTFELLTAVGSEVILGITLSFGLITLFAALSFVGRAMDLQIGFGAASIIDPTTNNNEALIGTIFTTVALVLFFVLDMHSKFIYGVSNSIAVVPFGQLSLDLSISKLVTYLSAQFLLGLSLILPTMIGLLSLDLIIGYTSKSMPQMNIYFVSLPLKIGAGIFLLFLTIPAASPVFKKMFSTLEQFWFSILGV